MIKKIYSKINPGLILSIIHLHESSSGSLTTTKRTEITDPSYFLQAGFFEIPANTDFKAHKHNHQERKTDQTHEAILIFKGSAEISIYDTDNSFVEKVKLKEGDSTVIINGGHKLKTLSETLLFEFKNGPYMGPDKDKTNFN